MAKIIAVANQKGGVGKTTTAVNLSSALAQKNKRVLVVDVDPQGNTTSGLGIDKKAVEYTIYDILVNGVEPEKAISDVEYFNMKIIPANIDLAGAEIELVGIEQREYRIKNALDKLSDKFDYIIVDCPPSLGLVTVNALSAVDSVIIPVQCEYYALEGIAQLTNTINLIKKAYNPKIEIEGVLMTMFDGRTNLSIQVVEEVRKVFGKKVYKTLIPRNVRLSEAPGFGEPINVFDKHSTGALAYDKLADEVIKS
ncbi:MAG: ParA family protein [Clostridia bacterium]|nr:ParA family protein [Clostridia bacterium]